ncbi:GNAT family N-acetyltransferase [Ruminococcaceae bacterium OttesenSCG-928-D13]|nr:GNAT family N-acetyltransferase [Ruminococcaceae bacterium OttesenSCG-928-D13]
MLKKSYKTDRLVLLQSDPALAGQTLDFYERNKAFFKEIDPLREKLFYTEDFQRRALARDLRGARELTALRLWLRPKELPENAPLIGMVALGGITFGAFRSAFVSYKLDHEWTGLGLMAEGLAQLVEIAFEDIGLHRLEANVMPRNTKSIALVQRLGFENEGLAKRYLNIGGVWEDHVHMVRLNEPTTREV